MTAGRRDLPIADELVLDALARRLGAIDDELPRLRPWRSDRVAAGQLHVVRGRVRRGGATGRRPAAGSAAGRHARRRLEVGGAALAAAIVVAILATGRGLDVGRPAVLTGAGSSDATTSAGGATGSTTPTTSAGWVAPSPAASRPAAIATPLPTRPAVAPRPTPAELAPPGAPTPVDAATLRELLARGGVRCGVLVSVALVPLGSNLIDKLALSAADTSGYVGAPFGPAWIGTDPEGAARAFKGAPLLVDPNGSLWAMRGTGADAIAIQVVPEAARSGVIAWRSADVLWPAATCPPPGTDAKSLVLGRAAGDWPTGQVVDLAVVRAGPTAPGTRLPT